MDFVHTEYEKWRAYDRLEPEFKEELASIAGNEKEIADRFYAPLEFGTAGLRGIMGAGINRMNIHVVSQTTQGIARLILDQEPEAANRGVAVGYDCRKNSLEFARAAASVLAGNGIKVLLFDGIRPTPEVSFAIRHYGCIAGINITASHNPKEYNGYKVYWEDGAQLPPEHADVVWEYIKATDIFDGIVSTDFDRAVASGMIRYLGSETDEAFLKRVLSLSVNPGEVRKAADEFRLVYTPFHGTGYRLVPEALARLGFKHILCEPHQSLVDGSFPTVKSPNPEDKEGFALAIELARREDVDLIIGTDPDADRVGIVVRREDGEYVNLSGNQVGVLLLQYLITAKKAQNTLPKNAATVKSVVTTELARAVAEAGGVAVFESFTGFKFIAERIAQIEKEGFEYIFAYEESYGYLAGDHARDKDAVTASMLIAEMAAYYFNRGKTLYQVLQETFAQYGYYREITINLRMPGQDGLARMNALMDGLRKAPPSLIAGVKVAAVRDYLSGVRTVISGNTAEKLELSDSNVLYFEMEDGSRFIIRPSGTEPKIKIYILVKAGDAAAADRLAQQYADAANQFANQ